MKKFVIVLILLLFTTLLYALTYQFKTQVISVTTSATKLPTTALVGREYVCVQNIGTATVYLGASTVTADTASTGGRQLLPYKEWCDDYDHTVDVYGIVASGTNNVEVEEGK